MKLKQRLKGSFFKIIDILPSSLGYSIYHAIQKKFTSSFHTKIEANLNTFKKIDTLLKKNGGLENKAVLEIGSGWMPIMPYLLKLYGNVRTILTYDINEHYDNHYIEQLNDWATEKWPNFERPLKSKYSIPEFVEYFPNSNVIHADIPSHVDLVFSRFVLEHVTPQDLRAMHQRFYNTFKEDTLILHLISPSDHRAYSDSSISHYDFLQYSEKEWNRIQTKFDYHNRMRLPQYLDIFEETGFEVVYLEYDRVDTSSEKYKKFKAIKVHQDFIGFSEEELLAGSINVILRKKVV